MTNLSSRCGLTQRDEDYAANQPLCLVRAPHDFGESANQDSPRLRRQFSACLLRRPYSCQAVLYASGYADGTFVRETLVAHREHGATRLARRDAESFAKGLAEVGEILEAPRARDVADRVTRLGRIQQIAPAVIQPLVPDQVVNRAAGGADRPVQAALR